MTYASYFGRNVWLLLRAITGSLFMRKVIQAKTEVKIDSRCINPYSRVENKDNRLD